MQYTFLSCLWSRLSTTHEVWLSVWSVVVCDHVYQQLMQSTFLWSSVITSINNSCSLPFCVVCGRLWSRLSTTHTVCLSVVSVLVCDLVYQQLMQSTFLCCLWSSVIMSINNSCSLPFCLVCGRLCPCLSTTHAVYLSVLSVVVCDHVYQQLMKSAFLSCLWSSVIMSINNSCGLPFCVVWQNCHYIVRKIGKYGERSLLATCNMICNVTFMIIIKTKISNL
jgi:ABC-type enterochelin transport system permease subunit